MRYASPAVTVFSHLWKPSQQNNLPTSSGLAPGTAVATATTHGATRGVTVVDRVGSVMLDLPLGAAWRLAAFRADRVDLSLLDAGRQDVASEPTGNPHRHTLLLDCDESNTASSTACAKRSRFRPTCSRSGSARSSSRPAGARRYYLRFSSSPNTSPPRLRQYKPETIHARAPIPNTNATALFQCASNRNTPNAATLPIRSRRMYQIVLGLGRSDQVRPSPRGLDRRAHAVARHGGSSKPGGASSSARMIDSRSGIVSASTFVIRP